MRREGLSESPSPSHMQEWWLLCLICIHTFISSVNTRTRGLCMVMTVAVGKEQNVSFCLPLMKLFLIQGGLGPRLSFLMLVLRGRNNLCSTLEARRCRLLEFQLHLCRPLSLIFHRLRDSEVLLKEKGISQQGWSGTWNSSWAAPLGCKNINPTTAEDVTLTSAKYLVLGAVRWIALSNLFLGPLAFTAFFGGWEE